jgi:hypothetical protein
MLVAPVSAPGRWAMARSPSAPIRLLTNQNPS